MSMAKHKRILCSILAFSLCFSGVSYNTAVDLAPVYAVDSEVVGSDLPLISNISANTYVFNSHPSVVYAEEVNGALISVVNDSLNGQVYVYNTAADSVFCISNPLNSEASPGLFGGYCYDSVSGNNFLVFGQRNPNDSDDVEVIRVVRYSSDWEETGHYSMYGENTAEPFYVGNCRMLIDSGVLYCYTSHQMYSYNNTKHQANMIFAVDTETMEEKYVYSDVMSVEYTGYISHSLDQYIKSDEDYLYCLDLGDAYPRSLSLVRRYKQPADNPDFPYNFPDFGIKCTDILKFRDGSIYPGTSVGGFEFAGQYCLSAISSINYEVAETPESFISGQRNIYLTITDKSLETDSELLKITYYSDDANTLVGTPYLVKISESEFLVMWEECADSSVFTSDTKTKCVFVELKNANKTENKKPLLSSFYVSDTFELSARLSDCEPKFLSDNSIAWLTLSTNALSGSYYDIYRLKLSDLYAAMYESYDINGDNCVNIIDFVLLKQYLFGCGSDFNYNFDINRDNCVNIFDLLRMKSYLLR